MKYIILCGSNHEYIDGTPRQFVKIRGERIIDRTIRLLHENGIEDDIFITATDPAFESCGVPVIHYDSSGPWINCFFLTGGPVTYIFGDVYFSEDAMEAIVNTPTDDIEFFASAPPFASNYPKPWAEPFAFKVQNMEHFQQAVADVKAINSTGGFFRDPIAWETWQVIKETPLNIIDYNNYVAINDYTSDIDGPGDIAKLEGVI